MVFSFSFHSSNFLHVLVNVLDHPVKPGSLGDESQVSKPFGVGRRSDEGTVRCIGCDIGKEGLSFILHFFDPPHPGGKKQICAIALGFYE